MAGLRLQEYCLPLHNLSVDKLIEQFLRLEENAEKLRPYIGQKMEQFREDLTSNTRKFFLSGSPMRWARLIPMLAKTVSELV